MLIVSLNDKACNAVRWRGGAPMRAPLPSKKCMGKHFHHCPAPGPDYSNEDLIMGADFSLNHFCLLRLFQRQQMSNKLMFYRLRAISTGRRRVLCLLFFSKSAFNSQHLDCVNWTLVEAFLQCPMQLSPSEFASQNLVIAPMEQIQGRKKMFISTSTVALATQKGFFSFN